jgi:ssDNA-binding Zn-finger/Zn-ribbon topoisomerase 1
MLSKYQLGYKYCPICVTYYQTEEVRCPKCHVILRAKPRKRAKHRQSMAVTPPEELSEVGA